MRWLFPFLFVVALIFGGSYAATIMTHILGPWSSTAVEHDGSLSHMQFAPDLPRPGWVPVYPDATVVQAARITSLKAPSGAHSLDLATRASLDEVKRFYTERLTASGFEVSDLGTYSLNPATAAMLGIAGALSALRVATDDQIDIQIRTPDGLIPSRMLQIRWRKISEFPAAAAVRAASAVARMERSEIRGSHSTTSRITLRCASLHPGYGWRVRADPTGSIRATAVIVARAVA